jgi:hypothetical protein
VLAEKELTVVLDFHTIHTFVKVDTTS